MRVLATILVLLAAVVVHASLTDGTLNAGDLSGGTLGAGSVGGGGAGAEPPPSGTTLPTYSGYGFVAVEYQGATLDFGGTPNTATVPAVAGYDRVGVAVYDADGVRWATYIASNLSVDVDLLGAISGGDKIFVHVSLTSTAGGAAVVTAYDPVASDDISEANPANRAAATALFAFDASTGKPAWGIKSCSSSYTGTTLGCWDKSASTHREIYYAEGADVVIATGQAQQQTNSQSWTLGESFTTTGPANITYDPFWSAAFAASDGTFQTGTGTLSGSDGSASGVQRSYMSTRFTGSVWPIAPAMDYGTDGHTMRCGRGLGSPLTWTYTQPDPSICVGNTSGPLAGIYREYGASDSANDAYIQLWGSDTAGRFVVHHDKYGSVDTRTVYTFNSTAPSANPTVTTTNTGDEILLFYDASAAIAATRYNTAPGRRLASPIAASDGDSIYVPYWRGAAESLDFNKGEADEATFIFDSTSWVLAEWDFDGNLDQLTQVADIWRDFDTEGSYVFASQNAHVMLMVPTAGASASYTFDPGGATETTFAYGTGYGWHTITIDESDWSVVASDTVANDFNANSSTVDRIWYGAVVEAE